MYRITALCAVALVAFGATAMPASAQVEPPPLEPQELCVEGSGGVGGGTFIDLGGEGYVCLFVDASSPSVPPAPVPPLPPGNTEAQAQCERGDGTFVDLRTLGYACLFPGGAGLPTLPGLPALPGLPTLPGLPSLPGLPLR